MIRALQRRNSRRGQTLVEYALVLAVLVIVCVSVILGVGKQTNSLYSNIQSQVARTSTGS